MVYFIAGVCVGIAFSIFVRTITGGNKNAPKSTQRDIDKNNSDIRQGFDKLRDNNKKSTEIIERATTETTNGIESIKNTRRSVSQIIADAERERSERGD